MDISKEHARLKRKTGDYYNHVRRLVLNLIGGADKIQPLLKELLIKALVAFTIDQVGASVSKRDAQSRRLSESRLL